jgi:hypothetical protein
LASTTSRNALDRSVEGAAQIEIGAQLILGHAASLDDALDRAVKPLAGRANLLLVPLADREVVADRLAVPLDLQRLPR